VLAIKGIRGNWVEDSTFCNDFGIRFI